MAPVFYLPVHLAVVSVDKSSRAKCVVSPKEEKKESSQHIVVEEGSIDGPRQKEKSDSDTESRVHHQSWAKCCLFNIPTELWLMILLQKKGCDRSGGKKNFRRFNILHGWSRLLFSVYRFAVEATSRVMNGPSLHSCYCEPVPNCTVGRHAVLAREGARRTEVTLPENDNECIPRYFVMLILMTEYAIVCVSHTRSDTHTWAP